MDKHHMQEQAHYLNQFWALAGLNGFVQEDLSGIQLMIKLTIAFGSSEPLSPSSASHPLALLSLNPHCQGLLRHSLLPGRVWGPSADPWTAEGAHKLQEKIIPAPEACSFWHLNECRQAGHTRRNNNGLFLTVLTPSPWTGWNPAKVLFFAQKMGNGNLERIKNTFVFNQIFWRSNFQYSFVFYFKEINLR